MSPRDIKHLSAVLTAHNLAREVLYERVRRERRPFGRAESLAVEIVDTSFDLVLREAQRRLANRARRLDRFAHAVRQDRTGAAYD